MHLESLFSPRSIAVIGASTNPGTVGWTLTENLLKNGYQGNIYPVNPKTTTLFDLPCYKSVSDIPEEIELAIIIVPAIIVPQVLRESGSKGANAAVIISSGFKETGVPGEKLEQEIAAIAKEFDIALLGPNCLGFLHPEIGLNASFAKLMPASGNIAFFSQSGALCTALLDLTDQELGFSHFVSTGNKAVIDERELLRFFSEEKHANILSFYTEGLSESRDIIDIGRNILCQPEPKPIIALKSGTTDAGTAASSSHTGSLAGSDAAYQALFRQARIIRAESLEHLVSLLRVFSNNPLPQGKRLAIITNAGGLGVLATDAAIKNGLEMSHFSSKTEEFLKKSLPASAGIHNPIDILGDALADRYQIALETAASDPHVDMLLVIITPQTMTQAKKTAEAIVSIKERFKKPIVAVFSGKDSLEDGSNILHKHAIASILYPETAAQALAALAQVSEWRTLFSETDFFFEDIDRKKVADIFSEVRSSGRTMLSETEASEIFKAYGFPFLTSRFVQNKDEAKQAALAINRPVALKIVSPNIIHKSDVGGVLLGITPEEADHAYDRLMDEVKKHVPEAILEGALVVEMAETGGQEIILGMKKEPGLGGLIMAGLGGIYVETFKDISFRFSPLSHEDAEEMLLELRSFPLLAGTRGKTGVDISALKDFIGRLSQLVSDFPEIEELDINPLLAFSHAADFRVLDARLRISSRKNPS